MQLAVPPLTPTPETFCKSESLCDLYSENRYNTKVHRSIDMAGKMIPQRNATPAEHQWDLTPLFESDQRWETMFVEVEAQLSSYQKYNGHLKESVAILKEAIDFHLETYPED